MQNCNICHTPQNPVFTGKILQKHTIQYYECPNCGYINTEKPYWLEEAYSDAIASSDTGYVYRNYEFAKRVSRIIKQNFDKNSTFLDYGAGYGMFVRLMRDFGFQFYYYDLYCKNLFAIGLEKPMDFKANAFIALEVFEHIENPAEEVEKILQNTDTILFSTLLRKNNYTSVNDWWYFSPETGQHISIYTKKSLQELANRFGLALYSNGKDIHVLSKKKIKWYSMKFDLYRSYFIKIIENFLHFKRPSLMQSDYIEVKKTK